MLFPCIQSSNQGRSPRLPIVFLRISPTAEPHRLDTTLDGGRPGRGEGEKEKTSPGRDPAVEEESMKYRPSMRGHARRHAPTPGVEPGNAVFDGDPWAWAPSEAPPSRFVLTAGARARRACGPERSGCRPERRRCSRSPRRSCSRTGEHEADAQAVRVVYRRFEPAVVRLRHVRLPVCQVNAGRRVHVPVDARRLSAA